MARSRLVGFICFVHLPPGFPHLSRLRLFRTAPCMFQRALSEAIARFHTIPPASLVNLDIYCGKGTGMDVFSSAMRSWSASLFWSTWSVSGMSVIGMSVWKNCRPLYGLMAPWGGSRDCEIEQLCLGDDWSTDWMTSGEWHTIHHKRLSIHPSTRHTSTPSVNFS